MKSTIAICLMASAFVGSNADSEFLRKMKRELSTTCDPYCQNENSNYCSPSTLADASIRLPKNEQLVGDNTEYGKCYQPWKGDGFSHPVMCPPANDPNCETCGYSSVNLDDPLRSSFAPWTTIEECCPGVIERDENGINYSYDYRWNIAKAYRSAYDAKQGSCYFYGLFGGCNKGYNCRDRSWWGKGTCKLNSDSKFYGESCSNSDQCNNDMSKEHVNMVCSRLSSKCILSEEAQVEHLGNRVQCSCSVFDHGNFLDIFTGFISCQNYETCNGNWCTLTTQDGNKYCDDDGYYDSSCSNCRASDRPCKA